MADKCDSTHLCPLPGQTVSRQSEGTAAPTAADLVGIQTTILARTYASYINMATAARRLIPGRQKCVTPATLGSGSASKGLKFVIGVRLGPHNGHEYMATAATTTQHYSSGFGS